MSTDQRLRTDPNVLRSWLDRLDQEPVPAHGVEVRQSTRFVHRKRLIVELRQGGGDPIRYVAVARNLSRGGVGFLVGRMLHPGMSCRVHLATIHGHIQVVDARVMRCRYLEGTGSLYEVGARFKRPVDLELFNPRAIHVRLLFIDANTATQRLVQEQLKALDADLAFASDGEQAAELAMSQAFDLVLVDLDSMGRAGFDAIRQFREEGYVGGVVAMSAQRASQMQEQCLESGCSGCILKPLTADALIGLILSSRSQAVESSLRDDVRLGGLINRFVDALPERIRVLEAAFREHDLETLDERVRVLKGESGAHGFDIIAAAAADVQAAIEAQAETSAVRSQLNELVRLCLSAQPVTR